MAAWTYIMASKPRGTLYIGVTTALLHRAWQHRAGEGSAFCKKYRVNKLMYFEAFESVIDAIAREKRLKKWPRQWKINLIELENPHWDDLYPALIGEVL